MCVNHLIHRDYTELGAEVAINIYDNRIETTSPGGSKDVPELTPVDPYNTASYRRNPIVAEVFAQLKYMEKRGSGLKKIINTTSMLPTYKDDKKPYFRSSRSFFFTTQENHPINGKPVQKKVRRTAQQIIDCLIEDPGLTREKLAEKLGKSESTIKEHLGKLQALEIIQRVGANKNGYWKVLIKK